MEDIIDIIVTETTNTIEITSQGTDEIIDVNIIDNREDIVLNVTPTVVEININSLTGNFGVTWGEITGTLSNQTDLNTALGLKADLVGGKVPSSQLPSYVDDIVEVANYAALPATGETGKIYITLDTNKIYRWSGSAYIEIIDSAAVWGAITGTLSSQTDLQSALNAKFDDPTGDTTQYIAGDGSLITFPVAGQSGTLVREVRNTTGATLTKGTIVYISGATGNKPTVSKAIATGDSTSAQTFGMCQANISNNSNGYVVCVGDLGGLDTSALTEGAQLYLSSTTAGTYTTTKQLAPAHLVYIGVVTRAHPTQGQIEVKIQNGYELDEIHDVAISSVANNQGLFYEASTDLWKNKSIATVLGYTPANGANYLPLTGGTLSGQLNVDSALRIKSGSATGILLETYSTNELRVRVTPVSTTFDMNLVFPTSTGRTYTFPNANGTLALTSDLSVYALDSAVVHNTGNETITGIKYFFSGSKHDLLFVSETVGYASIAGYSHFKANTDHVEFINGTNTKATKFIHGNGNYAFTMPNASGTIALTSNLSSYLPLSGGTLTGALSGTSATFSVDELNTIFVSNPTTTGATTGSGLGFKAYNGTSVTQSAGIFLTSNTWSFGTYSANQLSVGSDGTGGLALRSANSAPITFHTGGASAGVSTEKVRITSSGNVGIGTTSPLNATGYTSISLNNATNGGILDYQQNGTSVMRVGNNGTTVAFIETRTATPLVISTNDTERMRITSAGNVGINATPGGGNRFVVKGEGTTGSFNSISLQDSSANDLFYVRCDGYFNSGLKSVSPYNFSTAGRSMVVDSAGGIGYLVSTRESKTNIKSISDASFINKLNPVQFNYRKKDSKSNMFTDEIENILTFGFIADEVEKVNKDLVFYNSDNSLAGVDYNSIIAILTKSVQELKAELDTLKNK